MVFATDLDDTMIFSHRRISGLQEQLHCVEIYEGRPITYMTFSSIKKLNFLMDRVHVIPVTTRSISQFKRVEFFSNTEFAIVDNGGVILHNGAVVSEWERHIQKIFSMNDLESALGIFNNLPSLTSKPKIVDNYFVFAKVDDTELCKNILKQKLDTKIFELSVQGKKIYAIPRGITKGAALKYICKNLISNDSPVIASGDSNLDLSMLRYADYGLISSDCSLVSLKQDNGFIKMGFGIYSSEHILDFVINKSIS